jgi:hypothetical protein
MLNSLIDRFQAKFPPNRLVALAMAIALPTVIAPAAGYVAAWVPANFPELPTFTSGQLAGFAVTGFGAALLAGVTAGYKWLDGWQKQESRQHDRAEAILDRRHKEILTALEADVPEHAMALLEDLRNPPREATAETITADKLAAKEVTAEKISAGMVPPPKEPPSVDAPPPGPPDPPRPPLHRPVG